MYKEYLMQERALLQKTQEHHVKELYSRENPTGILLCQKHEKSFRWVKRELQNGKPGNALLRKTQASLAEKLAVNLYRIICIQHLQKQILSIDALLRDVFVNTSHQLSRQSSLTSASAEATQHSDLASKTNEATRNSDLASVAAEATRNSDLASIAAEATRNSDLASITDEAAWHYNPVQRSIALPQSSILTELSFDKLLSKLRNYPHTPAEFFHYQSPYRPFILSYLHKMYAEIISWYTGEFHSNPDHPEALQFPVKLGYNVRSKSEVLVANRLYEEGILFHYEERLLAGHEIYPDFYIPITYSEKYAWEHFGAMDKDNYFHRTRGKILNYLDHQWLPGINMITTYETRQHPLTEELVDWKIRWLKSRYRLAFPDLPPDESINLYDLAAYAKSKGLVP